MEQKSRKRASRDSRTNGNSRKSSSSSPGQFISLKRYPRVRRLLPVVIAALLLWYIYTTIRSAHSGKRTGDFSTMEPTCTVQRNSHINEGIVLVDSIGYDELSNIGGTGHWFHLLERIVPVILGAAKTIWLHAYTEQSRNTAKNHLYIVFRDPEAATELDPLGRFLLSSILGGGLYDKVFIGYTGGAIDTFPDRGNPRETRERATATATATATAVAHVRDFRLTASLLFHPGEQVAYSEVVGTTLVDHPEESTEEGRGYLRSETAAAHSELCGKKLMEFGWEHAPSRRTDLMGTNSTMYDLLHQGVDRSCGWETSNAERQSLYSGADRNPFEELMKSLDSTFKPLKKLHVAADTGDGDGGDERDPDLAETDPIVYREDNLLFTNEYGAPLDPLQVQGQVLQTGTFYQQDELAMPTSDRFARKLRKYRAAKCGLNAQQVNMPSLGNFEQTKASENICNGTESFMVASNAAGLNVIGWKRYSKAHVEKVESTYGINVTAENRATLRVLRNQLRSRRKRQLPGSSNASTSIPDDWDSREFVLPHAPVATEVPLNMLIYDRDQTRRLSNIDAIVGYLQKRLQLTDENERHSYFPLYFTEDPAPRARPKKEMGTLRGVNSINRKGTTKRRKSGSHFHDTSNSESYGHGDDKDNWVIDVVTHNSHNSFNDHVHISGVSGKVRYDGVRSAALLRGNITKNNRHSRYSQGLKLGINEEREVDEGDTDTSRTEILEDSEYALDSTRSERTAEDLPDQTLGIKRKKRRKKAFGNGRRSLSENQPDADGGARQGTTTAYHPPCELIRTIKEATVLLTPHGFQSILMLFQPKKSLLIEIMPFGYHKPEIFGLIQAGMRSIPSFGESRSYLVHESHPTSILTKALHLLGLTGENAEEDRDRKHWLGWGQAACTQWALCRHLVRHQDVVVDEVFLRRVVDYVKNHFVSNRNIKNIDFF